MIKHLLTILILILLIAACDDEGTTISPKTSPNVGEMTLSWLGEFASHPTTCDANVEYDAYYNTTEGKSYFCDGIDWRMLAQNGTDGTDGTDGMTIKVSDSSGTLLGYTVGFEYLFSPNGYLYYIDTNTGVADFEENPTFFMLPGCTGDALTIATSNAAMRGILVHDTYNDIFFKRRDDILHTTTPLSRSSQGECTVWNISLQFYTMNAISREDAGIPATVTLPLVYEFK